MCLENLKGRWLAVHVRPQSEKLVAILLRSKGYQEFLPTQTRRRQWLDRQKDVQVPLFPGYVFCRFDGQAIPIVTTPGVIRIVGIGNMPVPIEDSEIASLQRIAQSGVTAAPWLRLVSGETVQITGGPLSGVRGTLSLVKSKRRLIVTVTLLGRSVFVELPHDWVTSSEAGPARPVAAGPRMQFVNLPV